MSDVAAGARCRPGSRSDGGVQRQPIAVAAETADHADRDIGQIGVMAERFARMHVGQVHLDERDRHRAKASRSAMLVWVKAPALNRIMRGLVVARLVDAADQLVLGIGLEPAQLVPGGLRLLGQLLIDVGQRLAAVDVRLAHAQQIEVGSMQGQDLRHATVPACVRTVPEAAQCARSRASCPVRRRSAMFDGEVRDKPCAGVCRRASAAARARAAEPLPAAGGATSAPAWVCQHASIGVDQHAVRQHFGRIAQIAARCWAAQLPQQDRITHRMCRPERRARARLIHRDADHDRPPVRRSLACACPAPASPPGRAAPAGPEIQQHALAAIVARARAAGRRGRAGVSAGSGWPTASRCRARWRAGWRCCSEPPTAAASTARPRISQLLRLEHQRAASVSACSTMARVSTVDSCRPCPPSSGTPRTAARRASGIAAGRR